MKMSEEPAPKKKKMTHSEFLAQVEEKSENLKGGLDNLVAAKKRGNDNQVSYWVGKTSRDLVELSKLCMGEVVARRLADKASGIIIPDARGNIT